MYRESRWMCGRRKSHGRPVTVTCGHRQPTLWAAFRQVNRDASCCLPHASREESTHQPVPLTPASTRNISLPATQAPTTAGDRGGDVTDRHDAPCRVWPCGSCLGEAAGRLADRPLRLLADVSRKGTPGLCQRGPLPPRSGPDQRLGGAHPLAEALGYNPRVASRQSGLGRAGVSHRALRALARVIRASRSRPVCHKSLKEVREAVSDRGRGVRSRGERAPAWGAPDHGR